MIECPAGYYCPAGVNEPIPCPVGTYNVNSMAKNYEKCLPCPEGTACDVTGIADYKRKLCPPGYYCPLGSYVPTACPQELSVLTKVEPNLDLLYGALLLNRP